MCGFVGFTGLIENRAEVLTRMANRIIHRGPDMEGYHIGGEDTYDSVALGFRRLSIIDLADGKQPMYNEDGTVVVTFNGEIYNFMELRDELIAKGHIFQTRCDTEVLVHGYEEYGESLASKLRGMYAFVIWDTKTNSMYGARDIFGIKPFYYSVLEDGNLIFGSEIKSFLEHPRFRREVNPEALRPYLTFQYSAMTETFFRGTYKMPPAHYFKWQNGKMTVTRYWDADFTKSTDMSFEACADEINNRVIESVASHRISDVKVGSFLSGGVDSSVVAALLIKAIGKQLVCVHVNHGLMRKGESENVIEVFKNGLDANLVYVDATDRFLSLLEGVSTHDEHHAAADHKVDASENILRFLVQLLYHQVHLDMRVVHGDNRHGAHGDQGQNDLRGLHAAVDGMAEDHAADNVDKGVQHNVSNRGDRQIGQSGEDDTHHAVHLIHPVSFFG